MWTRLMESQIWCCCSVALCGGGLRKGTMLLPGLWRSVRKKTVPQHLSWCQTLPFLPICHWCPFNCCPCAGSQREWVCLSPKSVNSLLRGDSWESWSFFCCRSPYWFTARSYMDLSSGCVNLGWVVWCGAGIPCSRSIPPSFYPPHMGVGPPILYRCISNPPTHLDECDFFISLVVRLPHSSIFWQFWVIFVL